MSLNKRRWPMLKFCWTTTMTWSCPPACPGVPLYIVPQPPPGNHDYHRTTLSILFVNRRNVFLIIQITPLNSICFHPHHQNIHIRVPFDLIGVCFWRGSSLSSHVWVSCVGFSTTTAWCPWWILCITVPLALYPIRHLVDNEWPNCRCLFVMNIIIIRLLGCRLDGDYWLRESSPPNIWMRLEIMCPPTTPRTRKPLEHTIYMRTIWIIAINHHHLINNNVSISIPFDPNPTTDRYDDGFNCLDVPCSATHIHTPPICYCECPVRGALHPVSNQHLLWVSLVSPPVCPPIDATRPVIAPWIHT